MIRVLFVCLGNICRSPMAEAVFIHLVREAGLQDIISADSAGTGDWHVGSPPHHGTAQVLAQNGISYEGCARQLQADDFTEFDYIITMDDENLREVRSLLHYSRRKETVPVIAPLLSYAARTGVREVPDPYYGGGFDRVYELVKAGAVGVLQTIRKEHNL